MYEDKNGKVLAEGDTVKFGALRCMVKNFASNTDTNNVAVELATTGELIHVTAGDLEHDAGAHEDWRDTNKSTENTSGEFRHDEQRNEHNEQ